MGTYYNLHLQTEKTSLQIVNEWFTDEEHQLKFWESDKEGLVWANYPFFQISSLDERLVVSQRKPKPIFGFLPTISVDFRLLPNNKHHDLALQTLRRTSIRWLVNTDDMLCILYNYDQGMLLRSHNGISIHPRRFIGQNERSNLPFDFKEEEFNL